jgi:hypothetical protein
MSSDVESNGDTKVNSSTRTVKKKSRLEKGVSNVLMNENCNLCGRGK